jgi:type II secretory pathway pseudopilin PulG
MTSIDRVRKDDESGVVLIIFALAMVILLGMIAIAIDGGYGFVQNRRAQNAADFAAFAAAQQLSSSTYCSGTASPSTQQIAMIVQKLVDDNGSGIGTGWTAQFLNSKGAPIGQFTSNSGPATPPPGACGVSVNATPQWKPFFAGIFGIHKLQGFASGSVGNVGKGPPIGIIALNKVGPHAILGGGTGKFVVAGTIFLNTDVAQQPWTSSSGGLQWDDGIDAKTDSNLFVYGTIDTVNTTYLGESLWPLDWCFQSHGVQRGNATGPTTPGPTLPNVQDSCAPPVTRGTVTVDYNAIDNSFAQITDPLGAMDAPASPLNTNTDISCPGLSMQTNPSTQVVGGVTELLPGEYTTPVEITGNTNFQDCSGFGGGEAAYPGVYRFDEGVWINPGAGASVTGSNVVLATLNPYPLAGNVPGSGAGAAFVASGSGNGAPCLPSTTLSSAASGANGVPETETTSNACGGTSPTTYGVRAFHDTPVSDTPDSSMSGTGNNFSAIIGGGAGSQVNISGPTTGPYAGVDGSPGIVLYQDSGTQANYGFNAEAGDAASITLNGVVYNASLANYGANSPQDYWDGEGGGIPFYAGGTLQTGFGAGWTSATGPTPSAGSVTINGTAIVDDFNTDGNTNITILGQPYNVPGSGSLSFIG